MKGVSPVVSAVLLIALTVGIAAIVINWASGYTRSQINTVSQNTKTNCAFVSAQFKEEPTITVGGSESTITLKLLNTGSYDITSEKQTVIWKDGSTTVFNGTFTLPTDSYMQVVLSNNTNCTSGCGSFSGKSLDKIYISVKDCEGNYIEW